MFCSSCGQKLDPKVKFCSNCGATTDSTPVKTQPQASYQPQQPVHSGPYQQQPTYYQPQPYLPHKSEGLALILSWFILPGAGQIYAGKIGKGVGFMIGIIIGWIFYGISFIFLFFWSSMALWVIIPIIMLGIQIWCIVDAYQTAKSFNSFVARTGRAPNPGDTW